MKRKLTIGRLILLAVVGFVALCIWIIAFPHVSQTKGKVSLSDAHGCPIPLPTSATNIQFLKYHQLNFFSEYVRFEAPVEVCTAHVSVVLDAWRKRFKDDIHPDPDPLAELNERPMKVWSDQFDLSWFDVQNIEQGVKASGGGSGIPRIWIDTSRGIFYYELTD